MARGDVVVFNTAKEWLCDGTFDLDGNTIKCAICDNTTAPAAGTATPSLGDFTQVGDGGTYVSGGETLTCTWVESSGTVTFDSSTNPTWAANAGNDTDAYWGIVYASGSLNGQTNPAICYVDLDGPVDMSAGALTITWNGSGIFTLA
jgi:hypothetical protein